MYGCYVLIIIQEVVVTFVVSAFEREDVSVFYDLMTVHMLFLLVLVVFELGCVVDVAYAIFSGSVAGYVVIGCLDGLFFILVFSCFNFLLSCLEWCVFGHVAML